MTDATCRVCGQPTSRGATCSSECARVWRTARHLLDPTRASGMAAARARSALRRAEPGSPQHRWAQRVVSGELQPRPTHVRASSAAFRALVDVLGPEAAERLVAERTGAVVVQEDRR